MSEKSKHRDRWLRSRPELGRLRARGGLTRTVVVDGASISTWCTRVGAIYDDVVRRIVEEADAGDRKVILVTSAPRSLKAPHVVVVSGLTVARLLRGKAIGEIVTPDFPSVPSIICADVPNDRELLDAVGVAEHVLDIATGRLWKVGAYDVTFAAEHGTAAACSVPREVGSLANAIKGPPRELDRTYIVTQLVRAGDDIELRHVVVDDGVRRGASGHHDSIALLRSVLDRGIVPVMTSSMDVLDALYDAGVPLPRAVEDPALASVLLDPDTRAAPPGVAYMWRRLLGKREEGPLSFPMDQALDELPSLHAELRAALVTRSLLPLYEDDVSPTLPVFASIEREGFYVDETDLATDLAYIEDEMEKARSVILAGRGVALSDMQLDEKNETMAAAILSCDGQPPHGWRTKKPNLERLALSGNARAQAVEHMRGLHSIHGWMRRIEGTKRLRTILEPKATGRWYPHAKATSALPKHHPEAERLRKHLVPGPGHVFVAGDFAAVEPRLLAHQSQDPLLVAGAQLGKDIYLELMPILTVPTRDLAKKALLAFLFGQTAQRFAWKLPLPEREGHRIFAALEEALTGARSFRDSVQAADLDDSVSIGGWRRLRGSETAARFKTRAFNLKLQGSAADLLREVLRNLRDVLPPEARVVHQEFDAVILTCPKELVASVKKKLKHTMENVARLSVPLVTKVKDGATLAAIS